jgi:hypothetical protein
MNELQVDSEPKFKFDAMQLGPDLPLATFTSSWLWDPDRIRAMALYCSDGRWGLAFDEFCHKHLRIPRYDRWAVPGGPAWIAPHNDDPGFSAAARLQLDFLVEVHQLEQIVLITHYGCAYYGQRMQQSADDCLPVQLQEVRGAAATLRNWFPKMHVESYLAMRSGACLSFHGLQE